MERNLIYGKYKNKVIQKERIYCKKKVHVETFH